MQIILDVMGGDQIPGNLVEGGVRAAREFDLDIVLVGDPPVIRSSLKKLGAIEGSQVSILASESVIRMDEPPVQAVRKKRDSSLVRGLHALREQDGDALVSPGNTGAVVAGSLFTLGRIPGIPRPGLVANLPSVDGADFAMVDVGATVDCMPEHLVHFASMGSIYARDVMGISRPRVGLLSIGEEKGKGNRLASKTFSLLQDAPITFAGNVESHQLLNGRPVDVVVCDGFVGNVFLKATEGAVGAIVSLLKAGLSSSRRAKLGAMMLRPILRHLVGKLDYHSRGGAPLLGVNGVVIVAHGRSDADAIVGAIDVARRAVSSGMRKHLAESVEGKAT
ncbi:phosphate acyltransferase PlsX [Candidatus Bipolaricaulota bacterium]|nr:phosphate acyltransferase PlsX [Candidatus Bipolaricaulota bacterium]